jgi:hypothetical protein
LHRNLVDEIKVTPPGKTTSFICPLEKRRLWTFFRGQEFIPRDNSSR